MDDTEKYKNEPVHIFCDSISVITSPEVFLLAMRSGGKLNAYLLTPGHVKRLLTALKDQIDKFELTYGPIKEIPALAPILSPMQQQDLGPEKEG